MAASLEEVHGTIDTTGNVGWWKRFILFIGPAFMVCVGYMDPGNWATDIAGGSKFGYSLLWVLLMSNLIALLLQSLSARLGIVRGKDLAQASREAYPAIINIPLYVLAEIAIAACDLAEVLGMAIGLNLLFGLPLIYGVALAVLDTFLILYLQQKGIRYMEIFIFSLVSIIGGCFLIELFFAKPQTGLMLHGLVPTALNNEALYIAISIIGATVMPHNLYLHSSLVQTRRNGTDPQSVARAIKYNFFDSAIALNLAFFVNAAILVVSAAIFYSRGYFEVVEIQDAHNLLEPLMGKALAPVLFAVALIASGQSSTVTGTLAGQIIMEGYLDLRIAPWLRRLITRAIAVIPALLVIYFLGEDKVGDMLIFSQVILSLQLGFAVIPLIHFVSDKKGMGEFAIGTITKFFAWLCALVIVGLNIRLVVESLNSWHESLQQIPFVFNGLIVPFTLAAMVLLVVATFYPLFKKQGSSGGVVGHHTPQPIPVIQAQVLTRVAICLDFSSSDQKALMKGLAQGDKQQTVFHLIHVVESAVARATGAETRDYETHEDWKMLQHYAAELKQQHFHVKPHLGFGNPKNVIPELVKTINAELLVFGSHGHAGVQDFIYGETIRSVQHKVNCAVLIV
ncbi:MAG: Nramp family divalent metal transporter [Chitinophagales bacterium]